MDYFSGWCGSPRRLDNITAIVTGANAGLGKETTEDLFKRGARVVMACRNLAKAAEAKNEILNQTRELMNTGTLVVEEIDLSSLTSVRKFAKKILASEKHLHILINNAGVMCFPQSKTEDGFEMHMGTNHLGPSLLTLLLLPRLIESGPSRIIFLSSALHYFSRINFDDMNYSKDQYMPWEAYARSKIANVLFAKALAHKLEESNIKNVTTYSLHPGIVFTEIDRHVPWFLSLLFRLRLVRWLWKTPRCGAQTTIFCAVDEDCERESGLYYTDCTPNIPSSFCQNEENVTRLWDLTVKMIGFQSDLYTFLEK